MKKFYVLLSELGLDNMFNNEGLDPRKLHDELRLLINPKHHCRGKMISKFGKKWGDRLLTKSRS